MYVSKFLSLFIISWYSRLFTSYEIKLHKNPFSYSKDFHIEILSIFCHYFYLITSRQGYIWLLACSMFRPSSIREWQKHFLKRLVELLQIVSIIKIVWMSSDSWHQNKPCFQVVTNCVLSMVSVSSQLQVEQLAQIGDK